MKKMMKYFAAAVVAIVAVSCVKEMENGVPQETRKMVDVTFGVNISDADITKTSLGVENDLPAVLWSEGDKVAVWDGTQINEFTLVSGEGTSSAMFTGQVTEGAEKFVVIYPYEIVDSYKANSDADYPHRFNITPSEVQSAPVNGFAEKANMAAAYTTDLEGGVTMHNIGGYIKIQIEGTGINSVTVFDNNNVVISGYMAYFPLEDSSKAGKVNGSGSNLSSNHVTLVPENGKSELSEGTYYLVYRASKFDKGMTVKFTHVDGRVAYYSSSAANPSAALNTTINLGKVNASTLNWKKTETITIDFSKWPFEEEEPTETGITGTFTLSEVGKSVTLNVPGGLRDGSSGIKFLTMGDYVEFPIVTGKKLKEVHVLSSTGQDLKATVCDEEGNLVGGAQWALYTNLPYEFIVPYSELNTKYRYQVTANSSKAPHLKKITLLYAGDDVAQISGVTASATNSFTGFTVTGEVQGTSLDAATWGIQYGTAEGEWTDGPTGSGGKIEKLVEVSAGTYYVRTWASEDGGLTRKVYSDPVSVTVKAFSGEIVFDFKQAVNGTAIQGVKTTAPGVDAPTNDRLNKNRTIVGEDHYTYTTSDGTFPFVIYSRWDSETQSRAYLKYCLSLGSDTSSSQGLRENDSSSTDSYGNGKFWMSIPTVPGWKLKSVSFYAHAAGRTAYVTTSSTTSSGVSCADDGTVEETYIYYVHTADLSSTSVEGQDYFIYFGTNGYHSKFIFEYDQVN
ncbi:MAG: hypothetical protein E7123_08305 [Bacteroidales bacterium]|nr:hypothetical protein [Bacteroidales bacterium]